MDSSSSVHPRPRFSAATAYRLVVVTALGFASGLPLALTGQAMQAWLSVSGVDIATIGFLSLVGLPYTFKFLWAPLMDRFELPWLGRRRGWLVLTQLLLAGALMWMAATSPSGATRFFALLAVLVAFLSASQDVVIDAYRTDALHASERGLGSSLFVLGYRGAMIVSGGIAFIWVDPAQGGGWTWPEVYRFMAGVMVGAAVLSAVALPRLPLALVPSSVPRRDLLGFLAVLAAVAVGVFLSDRFGPPIAKALLGGWLASGAMPTALQGKWIDLAALMLGIAFTLPLAAWAARAARFETLLGGLRSYFSQPGAAAFLAFIVLYKLGDAFAGSLMTPFLLQAMQYSTAEVGVVNKVIGLWLTIGGALLGGALMLKLGLWRALLLFGVLQMASNLGFWWLAVNGRDVLPGLTIPAFDWGFVKLLHATPVDGGLLLVIAAENLSGGMGTAAFLAFLMSLCNQRFTATQFALLSAFASVGRVWVGPLAGVLAESIGWPVFFLVSTVVALPALAMLWWLRDTVRALEYDPATAPADD
ncbi:MFS transporter [Rhizobacter sp. Root404]|uniref:AmpG family muropeptide MFS transporter n=1 Tax=Rhizobacter sp. Root404 TaxID=1736528 RepID=UPI000700C88F|nr:MFS transporter [Rhizobacter sp. Root404]KQW35673.1 MFS transporter [Rhizobacter sp. Root404]